MTCELAILVESTVGFRGELRAPLSEIQVTRLWLGKFREEEEANVVRDR